ncbi:MAG: GNAT family N-acetyltransferase [Bauldia sp.]|nr:GNAT family N-acetyltransferase [Bauldia sp.]
MRSFSIGDAALSDIDGLVRLEEASFGSDRISRRSFRWLIRSASAICRVARAGDAIAGYAVVLTRDGGSVARLYSIAADKPWQGIGLATTLIADAERAARDRGMTRLRLEVREDNSGAIRLYERLGFGRSGLRAEYYADKANAIRYEKRLPALWPPRAATASRRNRQPAG